MLKMFIILVNTCISHKFILNFTQYLNKIVYNYHFVGRSLWLNKLLLPTSYTVEQENKIDFDSVDIDFSKYSLEDAVDFSKTFFRLSRELDNIAQVKQMVGEYLTIGILTTNGNVVLKSYNADL